jgi:hypothetical protein
VGISGSVEYNSLTAKELEVAYAGEGDQIFDVSTPMQCLIRAVPATGSAACRPPFPQVNTQTPRC